MKALVDYKELKCFLDFLSDKAEDVYQAEVDKAIKFFLAEQVEKRK
ncbi:hypothetical protein [Thermoactinomyces sp. DSM 45892]|nr:hypothetical protein [Thermoactinomyces sp. DSM 45892]SDZ38034.1 hypothetical protein SAMN05444416_1326 [Thermoactinomyces sp. DSM 45892]